MCSAPGVVPGSDVSFLLTSEVEAVSEDASYEAEQYRCQWMSASFWAPVVETCHQQRTATVDMYPSIFALVVPEAHPGL